MFGRPSDACSVGGSWLEKNKTNKQQQKTHRHKVVEVMLTSGVVRVLGAGPIIQI